MEHIIAFNTICGQQCAEVDMINDYKTHETLGFNHGFNIRSDR